MELVQQPKALEFQWHDVRFFVRARATAEDRFEINLLYDVDKAQEGKVVVPRRALYLTLIERFVKGWEGVTQDGQAVPFTLDSLKRLPADQEDDVILYLGSFILNNTGLFVTREDGEKKKG